MSLPDIEQRARQNAQELAQAHARKVGRQIAEAAAAKESNGDKATAAFTRSFNFAFPVLYEQCYGDFFRQEYARLLVG
jgi:hypothetical protein